MPATVSHALSMTTPDDPAYENQPKHWNSSHLVTLNAVGSEIAGAFANGNGISFGLSAGSVSASYTTPSTAGLLSAVNVSAGTTSNNLSALTFGNANGISFGLDASTVTAQHNALTSQSNQNVTAGNGGFAFQTLSFSNANGFSFGTSAGSAVTGSYTVPSTAGLISAVNISGGTTSSNVSAVTFGNGGGVTFGYDGTNVTASAPAAAPSPVNFSAGTTSNNLGTVVFSNSNGVSFGLNGSTITGSVATSLTNINVSAGTTSQNLSNVVFSNANGVSFGLNGSTVTGSVAAAGGVTLSAWQPYKEVIHAASAHANASLFINPVDVPSPFQYDRMVMPMMFTQATGSTLTVTNSVWWGLYSRNESTYSLYKSGSGTFSINGSGTASSANNSGVRLVSFASTDTIAAGNYGLAFVWRTTTGGANATISSYVASQMNITVSGYIGLASGTGMALVAGRGFWTSTTAGMPNSIAFSNIRGNSSAFQRQPIMYFTSGEITF